MNENNYPPGCSQRDHDEAFKDGERFCEECGSEPCSCHLCIDCGDDAPRDNHGRCLQCTHGPDCRCEDCYRGPDRLVDENGIEL